MSTTSSKTKRSVVDHNNKTPKKSPKKRTRAPSLKALENISTAEESDAEVSTEIVQSEGSFDETVQKDLRRRRSTRRPSPNKKFNDYVTERKKATAKKTPQKVVNSKETSDENTDPSDSETTATVSKPNAGDLQLLQQEHDVTGKNMFGFNTPKKRGGMALAAMNTPKTPKTPKTSQTTTKTPDTKRKKSTIDPKTPTHIRSQVRNQIQKLIESASEEGDFTPDESDFDPADESDSSNSSSSSANSGDDDEPKTPQKTRRPIIVPVLPKTPSANRNRQSARAKKFSDYVPMCDAYFQAQSSSKILTSDHTLDRLQNPRLPADRLFSLLAQMKLSTDHETSISALRDEYRTYFPKWMCILNEGFNLLLYGLGSKRELLQTFHREILSQQTVLVVNGFFPSLMLKDILDSITNEILDAGVSPANPHEAVDMIEEEFSLIPQTHLYLIIHNLDGTMLRNVKSQEILARLAKIPNIHLLASIDHINIPLLWDQTKLSNFNFSWWDCTTLLPYTEETAFENSLLVQNSGELALSSMRSVFSSLTTNSRGIYMLIVKHQLKNSNNPNYRGMAFKDLYAACRETFLVSSDLALRAQLTEFLDHKLVKSKRNVDGTEQLTIPISDALLHQFLDEQEKKD